VYAIEGNAEAAAKARSEVAARGFQGRIEVIEGHSTRVDLPQRVDLLVHEILGEVASIEGAAHVLRDARARLLAPPPLPGVRTSIPAWEASFICPCELPDADYWSCPPRPRPRPRPRPLQHARSCSPATAPAPRGADPAGPGARAGQRSRSP